MIPSIDRDTLFSYLRSTYDSIVKESEEIEKDIIDKVIPRLKSNLCKYLSDSLPEIEKKADEEIDHLLPCHSKMIEDMVNDLVNRMLEEIVREINGYLDC